VRFSRLEGVQNPALVSEKRPTPPLQAQFDQIVFDSRLVRIGAFRCDPSHPSFQDTGPAENYCFVFPRTAVQIQHEHEYAFVANPNVITFYNAGQSYRRNAISPKGDQCDWFGVEPSYIRDVMRTFDQRVDERAERPFVLTRATSNASTYLLQRNLFTQVANSAIVDVLAVEEAVLDLLDRVIKNAYGISSQRVPSEPGSRQRAIVHDIEMIVSAGLGEALSLKDIADQVGLSAFHVCHLFRQVTGTRLHRYRSSLRLRMALTEILESGRPLTDIALDAGFSSHSHFTSAFRCEFGVTPSWLRVVRPGIPVTSNFLIAAPSRVGVVVAMS
jgi:AraC-like DNA-binding protein